MRVKTFVSGIIAGMFISAILMSAAGTTQTFVVSSPVFQRSIIVHASDSIKALVSATAATVWTKQEWDRAVTNAGNKNDPMWNPVALDEAIRIRIAGCQAAK